MKPYDRRTMKTIIVAALKTDDNSAYTMTNRCPLNKVTLRLYECILSLYIYILAHYNTWQYTYTSYTLMHIHFSHVQMTKARVL